MESNLKNDEYEHSRAMLRRFSEGRGRKALSSTVCLDLCLGASRLRVRKFTGLCWVIKPVPYVCCQDGSCVMI